VSLLLDHLWQSTLVAALAALLTITLRHNAAQVRFWLWFTASMKFLIPFAALAALGRTLSNLYVPAILLPQLSPMRPAASMMLAPAQSLIPDGLTPVRDAPLLPGLPGAILVIWLAGMAVLTAGRLVRWRRLCRIVRQARPAGFVGPIGVRVSASLMEPGLVGIWRPVVLLPAGLAQKLAPREMDAILAHEESHYRRRDNLIATLHMLAETLFWFWPAVWFIGARMIAERERACDERVLAVGHDPQLYAGAIVKLCRFCVRAPLACVSGASVGLVGRVERIALAGKPDALGPARSLMLMSLGAMLLAGPLMTGMDPVSRQVRLQAAIVRHGFHDVAARITAVAMPVAPTKPVPKAPHVVRLAAEPLPAVPPLLPVIKPAETKTAAVAVPRPQSVPRAIAPTSRDAALAAAIAHADMALVPSGKGDPEAVTCRVPQYLPASRFRGPKICKLNRIWAILRARQLDYSPDGMKLVSTSGKIAMRAKAG
jgi:beta-lactamase regulating signal transducer with metallopeptidase domain